MFLSSYRTAIATGAFAIVEKCMYLPQNRIVAVKRLRPDVMKNEEDIKVRNRDQNSSIPVSMLQGNFHELHSFLIYCTVMYRTCTAHAGLDQGDCSGQKTSQQVYLPTRDLGFRV